MVRAAIVFNLILNKLESRQANGVKRKMVRATSVCNGKSCCAHLAERRKPLAKQRPDRFVALQIYATNLASAVIKIEVGAKLFVLGLGDENAGSRTWQRARRRRGSGRNRRRFNFAEVLCDVGFRS